MIFAAPDSKISLWGALQSQSLSRSLCGAYTAVYGSALSFSRFPFPKKLVDHNQ